MAMILIAGGTVQHDVTVHQCPEGDEPGMLVIGEQWYWVWQQGDDFTLEKFCDSDGACYTVADWSEYSFSCDCRDFKFRSNGGRRKCKHLHGITALRAAQAAERTVAS